MISKIVNRLMTIYKSSCANLTNFLILSNYFLTLCYIYIYTYNMLYYYVKNKLFFLFFLNTVFNFCFKKLYFFGYLDIFGNYFYLFFSFNIDKQSVPVECWYNKSILSQIIKTKHKTWIAGWKNHVLMALPKFIFSDLNIKLCLNLLGTSFS